MRFKDVLLLCYDAGLPASIQRPESIHILFIQSEIKDLHPDK